MAKYIPDKNEVSTPDDVAFQTGRPVGAGLFARQNQVLGHLLESVEGGGSTLDGSTEALMPQDHSGEITSGGNTYNHGHFIGGVIASGLGLRLNVMPFTDADWDADNGWSPVAAGTATTLLQSFPCRAYLDTKGFATDRAYYGHFPVRIRRGTNRVVCLVDGFQYDTAISQTAGRVYAQVFDSEWNIIASEGYDTLTQTSNLATPPTTDGHTDITRTVNVDLTNQLTVDTVGYVVIGYRGMGATSANYVHLGCTIYEAQI